MCSLVKISHIAYLIFHTQNCRILKSYSVRSSLINFSRTAVKFECQSMFRFNFTKDSHQERQKRKLIEWTDRFWTPIRAGSIFFARVARQNSVSVNKMFCVCILDALRTKTGVMRIGRWQGDDERYIEIDRFPSRDAQTKLFVYI